MLLVVVLRSVEMMLSLLLPLGSLFSLCLSQNRTIEEKELFTAAATMEVAENEDNVSSK